MGVCVSLLALINIESNGGRTYHVTNDKEPSLPADHGKLEGGPVAENGLLFATQGLLVALESADSQGALPLVELELRGVGREVGEDEEGNAGSADGGGALDDEQPPPSRDTVDLVQTACDGTGEETTERAGENGGGDVDGESLGLFLLLVPRGKEKQDTGSKTGLKAFAES